MEIMKTTNLLKKTGLVIVLCLLMIPALNAQNQSRRGVVDCQISNLTSEQNLQIDQLRTEHLKIMEGLREERRATTNADAKAKVREQMKVELTRHKAAVAKLLTPEQMAQYQQNKKSKGQCAVRNGNGKRNCKGNACGKGKRGKRGKGCRGSANS